MTDGRPATCPPGQRVRLDRWLWAARFFRTRAQAKVAIEGGKVQLGSPGHGSPGHGSPGEGLYRPKASKEITLGDVLEIRRGWTTQVVRVTGLSEQRGNATAAQALYLETPDSIEAREAERARRRMEQAGLRVPAKRPSKRDRREIKKLKHDQGKAGNS